MTRFIKLTQGQVALVDNEDFVHLCKINWTSSLDKSRQCYYAVSSVRIGLRWSVQSMHRIILERMLGRNLTKGEEVDHINHDTLDNRRENLRLASHSENMRNRKKYKSNTSGYKGVSWRNDIKKWHVQITFHNRRIHLGYFDDPIEAARAYDQAALLYFGDFANLNFEDK